MSTDEHTDPAAPRREDRERWEREWQEKQRRIAQARRASPAGRRYSVRERGLWAWFMPESRRLVASFLGGALAYLALYRLPGYEGLGDGPFSMRAVTDEFAVLGTLFIAFGTLYSLVLAGLTHWVNSHLSRTDFVAQSRLHRARLSNRWYRYFGNRSGPRSQAAYMLVMCGVAVMVLLTRSAAIPLLIPLMVTAAAIIAAWIDNVVTFAGEYAAEDSHGTGFELPGIPPEDRTYEEYMDLAVLVQTTSGPTGAAGLTRSARRAMRSQSVLAHVMSTVVVSLAVSVILTVLT